MSAGRQRADNHTVTAAQRAGKTSRNWYQSNAPTANALEFRGTGSLLRSAKVLPRAAARRREATK